MFFWSPFSPLLVFDPRWSFAKWQEADFRYGWSVLAQSLITQRGKKQKQEMCQTQLSPMNAHHWPRRGWSRKELLTRLKAVAPHPKWEVDKRRPLCIQSTSNYPGAVYLWVSLLPLSSLQPCLPFDRFPAYQSHSHRVGRWRKGWEVKLDQSFHSCPLDTLAKGGESLVKPTFSLFGVLIYQSSVSSFISMDNW